MFGAFLTFSGSVNIEHMPEILESGLEMQGLCFFLLAWTPSKPFTLLCHCGKVSAKCGLMRIFSLLRLPVEMVTDMLREKDGTKSH